MCTCGLDNCTECNPGEPDRYPEGTLAAACQQLHDAVVDLGRAVAEGLRLEYAVAWIARKAAR